MTSPVLPGTISPRRAVPASITRPEYVDQPDVMSGAMAPKQALDIAAAAYSKAAAEKGFIK